MQPHNELCDLEAEMVMMVRNDVEVEPVLQEVTGGTLNRSANKALMPVWIFMFEVFGRDKSAFFDVRVCHLNADSNAVCGKSNGD